MPRKSIPGIILSRVIGLLVFFGLLWVVNYLTGYVDNVWFHVAVGFVNANVMLIVIMAVVFLVAEVFGALVFPFDLPSPIFYAAGCMYLVTFLVRLLGLAGKITGLDIFGILVKSSYLAYPITFILVLLFGYIGIFVRLVGREKPEEKEVELKKPKPKKPGREPESFKEVWERFLQWMEDLVKKIRKSLGIK